MNMTTRQTVEIVALAVLCLVSLRTFWRGDGFSAIKKVGVVLAVLVFLGGTMVILH